MSDHQPRTYPDAGLQENSNRTPWWLIILWITMLAVGAGYIIKFAVP
jgi:hypothetical protein